MPPCKVDHRGRVAQLVAHGLPETLVDVTTQPGAVALYVLPDGNYEVNIMASAQVPGCSGDCVGGAVAGTLEVHVAG